MGEIITLSGNINPPSVCMQTTQHIYDCVRSDDFEVPVFNVPTSISSSVMPTEIAGPPVCVNNGGSTRSLFFANNLEIKFVPDSFIEILKNKAFPINTGLNSAINSFSTSLIHTSFVEKSTVTDIMP